MTTRLWLGVIGFLVLFVSPVLSNRDRLGPLGLRDWVRICGVALCLAAAFLPADS